MLRNFEKNNWIFVAFLLLSVISSCGDDAEDTTPDIDPEAFELVWSDEFDGSGAINTDNWFHQTIIPNGTSWFNGEIQHYTDKEDNSFVSDGTLKIVAIKENFTDQGQTKTFTSARLNSKFAFTYGRVDVRAKLPAGNGTWPAIWMLGRDITERGGYWNDEFGERSWPAIGEIDIMEHWGNDPNVIHGSLHTTSSSGATINTEKISLNNVFTDWHTYSMIWTEDFIQFLVDDDPYYTYSPGNKTDANWPFDSPQYLLLNVAISPSLAGVPASNFTEAAMEIDYVRVYQEKE